MVGHGRGRLGHLALGRRRGVGDRMVLASWRGEVVGGVFLAATWRWRVLVAAGAQPRPPDLPRVAMVALGVPADLQLPWLRPGTGKNEW